MQWFSDLRWFFSFSDDPASVIYTESVGMSNASKHFQNFNYFNYFALFYKP